MCVEFVVVVVVLENIINILMLSPEKCQSAEDGFNAFSVRVCVCWLRVYLWVE